MNVRLGGVLLPVAAACLAVICGCGRGARLQTAKVSGTVSLDGKPLDRGTVIFTPASGRAATGKVQPDGSYTLETYRPGDGAILGTHRVAVIARQELPGDGLLGNRSGPSLIPEFYGDSGKSGLSFEVMTDGPNVYHIELRSTAKPHSTALPGAMFDQPIGKRLDDRNGDGPIGAG